MSLKNFVSKDILFRLGEWTMGTKTLFYIRKIREMMAWSSSEINKWQEDRLQSLIRHAYANTLYYRRLFDDLRIRPTDIRKISDLEHIPKLTKEIIRANFHDLTATRSLGRSRKASSGGSMGDPLRFYVSHESWSFINAFKLIQWQRVGFNLGDNHIALGSSSLFPLKKRSLKHELYYLIKGKIPVNGISFTDEEFYSIAELINRKKVRFIYGYASAIYLFAAFAKSNSIRFPELKGIISTSEILLPEYYDTIKNAFAVPVLDAYGAADGGISAYKLDNGLFHVAYNAIAQVDKKSIDEQGPVLITDLMNYAFPFIRYELGDEVDLTHIESADFNGQIINKVIGRIPDVMRLKNGRVLTGPGFTILFKDLNVISYKISSPDSSTVTCEVQKAPNFSSGEESIIRQTLQHQVGEGITINLQFVDGLPPLPSGKRNYFIVKE